MAHLGAPHSVLIVDDDTPFRNAMVREFRSIGWAAAGAGGFRDGLSAFEQLHPRVTLVDYFLDDGIGTELIRRMKGRYRPSHLFLVSGASEPRMGSEAIRCGAVEILTKPLTAWQVLQEIEQHQQRRSQADLRIGVTVDHAIEDAIVDAGGSLGAAASMLGVSRRCLELRRKKTPTNASPRPGLIGGRVEGRE